MPKRIETDILYVDGDNLSRLDIRGMNAYIVGAPVKRVYQLEGTAGRAYKGYEQILVPHVGKESVDKVIGMDIVADYFQGVRRVAIASNDRDYVATALHLKAKFHDLHISLVCDPQRAKTEHIRRLARENITMVPLSGSQSVYQFTCQVVEIIHQLAAENRLTMPILGAEMRARGIEYTHLKRDLVRQNILTPDSDTDHVEVTDVIKQQFGGDALLAPAELKNKAGEAHASPARFAASRGA